jgi:hypothetical protein
MSLYNSSVKRRDRINISLDDIHVDSKDEGIRRSKRPKRPDKRPSKAEPKNNLSYMEEMVDFGSRSIYYHSEHTFQPIEKIKPF